MAPLPSQEWCHYGQCVKQSDSALRALPLGATASWSSQGELGSKINNPAFAKKKSKNVAERKRGGSDFIDQFCRSKL